MKGIVVDIKDSRAVVLKNDGSFENIKNKNYKIGQKVSCNSKMISHCLKIAACLAICFVTATVAYKFYYTPYSYLYIDINPSVRLDLNYFDVVINCTPLNKDAEFINVSSGDVEESINEVISECKEKGFLNDNNNEIEINISSENGKHQEAAHNIKSKYKDTRYKVVVKNTTKEEIEKANKHGISVKRHRTIEEFSTVFGGNTEENIEKLQDKTTEEIVTIVLSNRKKTEEPQKKEAVAEETEDHSTPVATQPSVESEDETLTEETRPEIPVQKQPESTPKEKEEIKKPTEVPRQNTPVVTQPDKNVPQKSEQKEPVSKPTMPQNEEQVEPPKPEKQEKIPEHNVPEQETPEQSVPMAPPADIDENPGEEHSNKSEVEEVPVFVPDEENVDMPLNDEHEKPDESIEDNMGQGDDNLTEIPEKQPTDNKPQQSDIPADAAPREEKPKTEPEVNGGRQPSNGMGGENSRPEPRQMK